MKAPASSLVCVGSGLTSLDVIYGGKEGRPQFYAGGSCCNVLTILSYLGWNSFPLARLGKDPEGDRIIEDMSSWGVDTEFVIQDTGVNSPRIIERIFHGPRPKHKFHLRCEHGKWLPGRRPYLLKSLESIRHRLPKSNAFYFDRADPSALVAARMLKKRGAVIVFEPQKFLHDRTFLQCLQTADIVKHCYGESYETAEYRVKIPLEIQTNGKDGLAYRARFLRHRSWRRMDAFPVAGLVDAAGSGDWLTAGLMHVLAQNGPMRTLTAEKLEYALRFGQALASINCSFAGARGAMYGMKRSQLLLLSEKTIAARKCPEIGMFARPEIEPVQSASVACRECLCSDELDAP